MNSTIEIEWNINGSPQEDISDFCSGHYFCFTLRNTDLIRILNLLYSIFEIFSFFFVIRYHYFPSDLVASFGRRKKENHFSHSPRVWFECTFSFWQMIPRANIDKEFFIIKYIKKGKKMCIQTIWARNSVHTFEKKRQMFGVFLG